MNKVSIKYSWDRLNGLYQIMQYVVHAEIKNLKLPADRCAHAVLQMLYLKIAPKTLLYKKTTSISFDAASAFALINFGEIIGNKIENEFLKNVLLTTVSTLHQAFA
jgi:hypothetical protein